MTKQNIIVTGGAGYIGAHVCKALAAQGYMPVTVDNLSNGHAQAAQWGPLEQADILDTEKLISFFKQYEPVAVIHLAALIEVGESVKNPASYEQVNVQGTQSLLQAMQETGMDKIVFSSTAAVYGQPDSNIPITEDTPLQPVNPYGETKLKAEQAIQDADMRFVSLRYFNASGADDHAQIGEMHRPETHLIPLTLQAALGLRDSISIFGTDYDTPDGTCIRDYVHVDDLADAHIKALEHLLDGKQNLTCNLGSGKGYSVREVVETVRTISGCKSLKTIEDRRRTGDPSFLVADIQKAKTVLSWVPEKTLEDMVRSAHDWHNSGIYKNFWITQRSSPGFFLQNLPQ